MFFLFRAHRHRIMLSCTSQDWTRPRGINIFRTESHCGSPSLDLATTRTFLRRPWLRRATENLSGEHWLRSWRNTRMSILFSWSESIKRARRPCRQLLVENIRQNISQPRRMLTRTFTLNTRPPHHLEMQINPQQVILLSQRWLPARERGLAANCLMLNPSKSHQNWPQSGTTSSQRSAKIEITTICSVGLHFYVQFKGLFICLLWFQC